MHKKLLTRSLAWLLSIFAVDIELSAQDAVVYPRITGHIAIVHPIVAFSKNGAAFNFNGAYTVGMPFGINIWKSKRVGFSAEFVPSIRAEGGSSKVNNLLIHPGILASLGRGWGFSGRVAFETSGRYGITPGITEVVKRSKWVNYFIGTPFPIRFGNEAPATAGVNFQFGIVF